MIVLQVLGNIAKDAEVFVDGFYPYAGKKDRICPKCSAELDKSLVERTFVYSGIRIFVGDYKLPYKMPCDGFTVGCIYCKFEWVELIK